MADETDVQQEVTEVPAFRDSQNNLRGLRKKDFPRSREGRLAFCDYKIECFRQAIQDWTDKKEEIQRADDPVFQKQRKMERLQKQLAALEEELATT